MEKDNEMRMLDPTIFEQEWFDELTPRLKLLFIYIVLKCDCGGIIEINLKRWSYDTGYTEEKFTREEVFKAFGKRIFPVGGDVESATKAFYPDFIRFNYGERLINDRKHVVHRAAVKRIKAVGLTVQQVCEMAEHKFVYDDFSNVEPTPTQGSLPTCETEAKNDNPKKTEFAKPTLEEVRAYFKEKGTSIDPDEFYAYYERSADKNGWRDKNGNRIKNWKFCLVTWEKFERGKGSSSAVAGRKAAQNITVSSQQAKDAKRVLG